MERIMTNSFLDRDLISERTMEYIHERFDIGVVAENLVENILEHGFDMYEYQDQKEYLFEYLNSMLCYSRIGIEPEEIKRLIELED